jgi:hypothetical protein
MFFEQDISCYTSLVFFLSKFVLLFKHMWVFSLKEKCIHDSNKISMGVWAWSYELGAFGFVMQKFLNIEWFFHWKLNWIVAENFGGIGMCLWCCWKDFDEQDLVEFIW